MIDPSLLWRINVDCMPGFAAKRERFSRVDAGYATISSPIFILPRSETHSSLGHFLKEIEIRPSAFQEDTIKRKVI